MAKGYKIKDLQTAKTLVNAGRETPWKDRHHSTGIQEPVGIFMRTQLAELETAAAEPDDEGKITQTDCAKKRVDWDETNEDPEPTLIVTEETTDGINIEQTPLAEGTPVYLTTDVYNTRLLMGIQPSEVFGKLASRWTGSETAMIQLDEGFTILGKDEVEMKPAPTITDTELAADTPVTCRFIKSLGEWRFFKPTGAGIDRQTAVLTVSGTALGGFGAHLNGGWGPYQEKTIWATQLSAASHVDNYLTTAIVYEQPAVASENDTPWLEFPTDMPEENQMTGHITHVWGQYYRWDAGEWSEEPDRYRIYLKSDYGSIFINEFREYKETFFDFNQEKLYQDGNGEWLYNDGFGRWMEGWDLGTIHQPPPENDPTAVGGSYGAATIAELGYSEKTKPYWTCSTACGKYEPKNGASGNIIFGLPTWEVTDDDGTQTFERSWKPAGNRWDYLGSVTIDEMTYTDVKWDSGKYVLGTRGSTSQGWYDSTLPPDPDNAVNFTFRIVTKNSKTATPAQILRGWESTNGTITYSQTRSAYEIADTPVAWWSLSAASVTETTYTFTFNAPQDSTVTGEPKTVTLAEILDHTWNQTNLVYDASAHRFRIGTEGDPNGWWTCSENSLQTSLTFAYVPADRSDLTFTFKEYIDGNHTEGIWYITPEIITQNEPNPLR